MKLNRLVVCNEVDQRLSQLKARTGLRANLLCRIGFCMSLNNPSVPNPDDYPPDSKRELNRYTLTGEMDSLYVAMLRERCAYDNLHLKEDLEDQFRAHINRGVLMMYDSVKSLSDLSRVVRENHRMYMRNREVQEG